jgi:hypothetical protein
MADVTYLRLRATDPARWTSVALAWRSWAAAVGQWVSDLAAAIASLTASWTGAAASAATGRLTDLRQRLTVFRVLCWQADQALSEFAAALTRARALLDRAFTTAGPAGVTIGGDGTLTGPVGTPAAQLTIRTLADALRVAAEGDATAADRLGALGDVGTPPAPPDRLPPCTATPAEVRQWWDGLTPDQQRWLIATQAAWLGPLDGIPAAYRDLANRLLLDGRRAEAGPADMREGLDRLTARLAQGDGPRAYLLRLDLAGEGRAVVALGDPDRAANVLTQVPGMTADLASYKHELDRAERVAVRAAQVAPASATSTILWLDYDAPDFVDEAASARQAEDGAPVLRRFQDGLRATHLGPPARQTVLGHSYGSLVVGEAARSPGLAADDVVFVGSPGVGVDSAAQLRVPEVWSSTSRTDIIQYAAVSPTALPRDLLLAATPVIGPALAFGRPAADLWFGHNPSDPAFGAHLFPSQVAGGHLGYWDPGSVALDAITGITVGSAASS